ncbi:MAG: tRNA (adenosine(37)-N6)-dimethylallyltransferase MiaA [Acidimicrobiales bacterium]|nr:tRNA (adenosine(37)-N6)-dimethylallyltransferase MiaA [Acidimicrobiales bacterium]
MGSQYPKVVLLGPTASGKTSVAIEIARSLPKVELVSVDAFAVYKGMDIGTAKPERSQLQDLAIHMIDLVEPSTDYSAGLFKREAENAISEIESRKNIPLLVGGSTMYLSSIIEGMVFPGTWPDIRKELEDELDKNGQLGLYKKLEDKDPEAAAKFEPTNGRRSVRALEVILGSGKKFSSYGPGFGEYLPNSFRQIGIFLEMEILDKRIEERVNAQIERGLVEEVSCLLGRSGALARAPKNAIGYFEIANYLRGELTLEAAIEEIIVRTKRFARRQLRWWRRDPRILWIDGSDLKEVCLTVRETILECSRLIQL